MSGYIAEKGRSRTVEGLKLVAIGPKGARIWESWRYGVRFQHLGTAHGGASGQRYTIEQWSIPGSEHTAGSLTSAVRQFRTALAESLCRAFYFRTF